MKIFLLGFMGAGKTTIGKYAARHNGLEFLDLDAWIEEQQGKEIRQIFAEQGEATFREIERQALNAVIAQEADLLISTGGGTPCFFDNVARMNAAGPTIYLDLGAARLTDRLRKSKGKRPLIESLKGDLQVFVHKKLMHRAPFYAQAQYILPEREANKKGVSDLVATLVR